MISVGTLETNIVTHCNNRCCACSHGSPWAEHYYMEPEALERDLKILERIIHCRQFYLLGGEPLLHPKLTELLRVVNRSSIGDETCILTNGSLVDLMEDAAWDEIDIFQISVYPKLDPGLITLAQQKGAQHNAIVGSRPFETFCKQFKADPSGKSFYVCPWKDRCLTVHDGYFFRCPQSAMFAKRFMQLEWHVDGLPITESLTEEQLGAFLDNKTKPLRVCEVCESFSQHVPWHECATEEEWIRESTVS